MALLKVKFKSYSEVQSDSQVFFNITITEQTSEFKNFFGNSSSVVFFQDVSCFEFNQDKSNLAFPSPRHTHPVETDPWFHFAFGTVPRNGNPEKPIVICS